MSQATLQTTTRASDCAELHYGQKTDAPEGVEITHELMAELRARNAQLRALLFGRDAMSRDGALTLLEAFDDLSHIVDDLLEEIGAQEIPQ
ncbi:hypothetical protein [Paraburkholderia caribensis]|uniref:hypothetical protein n=1 Tax=Paraburkholderia caribensis TaxID=75105 RepID=UPI001CB189FE|nr:hypothetical protein [Paraburkholderia caribensis]CAG9255918.1 hypothetical protein PCAR4_40171 [Paraburkholderia caribensis]